MARIRYNPSAKRRGFRTQQLSTAGIDRMREESNRLIQGMRSRHQAEDAQRERERRAMEADQAYQERITKENNEIELRNLQIEAEREVGGINAKIRQSEIDTKATMDILGSIASFSITASQAIAKKQADDLTRTLKQQVPGQTYGSIEDRINGRRAQAKGGVAYDAWIGEQQLLNNQDPRTSILDFITNPAQTSLVQWHQLDKNTAAGLIAFIDKQKDVEFTAQNGEKYFGRDILSNPELVGDFMFKMQAEIEFASGGRTLGEMPETKKKFEQLRNAYANRAIEDSFEKDRQVLEFQTNTLFRSGDLDSIAKGWSGAVKSVGHVPLLDKIDENIADPSLPDEAVEALLNFQIPMEGNKKPYRESHWKSRVGKALADREDNKTKLINQQQKVAEAAALKWTLQSNDIIDETIANTNDKLELEKRELELRKVFGDLHPTVDFPSTITKKFSNAKRAQVVDIRTETDKKFREGRMDLTYVNSIGDATEKKYARGKFEQQQEDLYGKGYKPFIANIDSLAKKEANFTSTIAGDTNGKVEALKAKMFDFAKNHELYSLSITQDANATHKAMLEYLRTAAITDGSNGDPLNPFRYKEGDHGREYLEFGVPDPDKKQHLNWVRKQAASSKTLGELIYNNPYLIPADKISKVSKAQELGLPIVFNDSVYLLARIYDKKPTEIHNAIVKRRNEVAGTNDRYVTPNDFTELQDNASPEWNKLISSGNRNQIERAGAMVTGQLPMRTSMAGGMRGLASLVSGGEGSPTSMFPGENYPEMTNMTIRDVVELQKEKLGDGRESAAVGSYQFLYPEVAAQRAGLSLDDKFTPENQLKMFVGTLINKPGRENVSAFLQGTGNDIETAIDELSQEFASIEYRDGRSYYDDGVNKASISRNQVRAALLSAREELTTQ